MVMMWQNVAVLSSVSWLPTRTQMGEINEVY